MELFLQFGYGMMAHSQELISGWGNSTTILSPRDLSPSQLPRIASSLNDTGGEVLVDPQFYLPHADHHRLSSHSYWPTDYDTGTFWAGPQLTELLTELSALNRDLRCSAFILPGSLASVLDEDWFNVQDAILDEARSLGSSLPLILTVALSADATRVQANIEALLEHSERWAGVRFYVVCEHLSGQYLVEDPNWLANILDLCAGLKLGGSSVILGYANQQMLIAACAKVDAIASGTWMNVRSFPPEKFYDEYQEERRTKATWYYCPQALSEYKLPFLDIAQRHGLLGELAPPERIGRGDADVLFRGASRQRWGSQ